MTALERWAAMSWRVLAIGAAAVAGLWLVWRLRLVVIPLFVALLIAVVVEPPARWLRRRGTPPLVAAWLSFLGFLASIAVVVVLLTVGFRAEFSDLGPTVTRGIDDVERWLIDGPLELGVDDVERLRREARESITSALRNEAIGGVRLVAEVVAGTALALVLAFLLVKDGPQLQRAALALVPASRREAVRRAAAASWRTLGGFVLGAATLGAIEAVVIGLTLAVVGAGVVLPMMLLTFAAAFIPFAGAIVAGVVAVLVALVGGGVTDAGIVAVVALAVQQLDNEVLAPWIYGRAVRLHPVAVLLAVTAGTAVAGVMGTVLAVPAVATTIAAISELRAPPPDEPRP